MNDGPAAHSFFFFVTLAYKTNIALLCVTARPDGKTKKWYNQGWIMEFLDPVARKKKTRRLFLGYGLVTILVFLATYILVATAIGFEIFKTNGEVVQNGLLFLDSKPVSANVYLDGNLERDRTSSRLALKSGEYNVTLKADGYMDWSKKIVIAGGKVHFATYPRLYPSTITSKDIKALPISTGMVTQSPDRHWLVIQPTSTIPSIDVYDLSQTTVPSASTVLPPSILLSKDGSYGTFELIEWADDNRHLLVSQKLADGKQNLLFLVGPEGGFTVDEVREAFEQGARILSLGDRIQRVETAASTAAVLGHCWLTPA